MPTLITKHTLPMTSRPWRTQFNLYSRIIVTVTLSFSVTFYLRSNFWYRLRCMQTQKWKCDRTGAYRPKKFFFSLNKRLHLKSNNVISWRILSEFLTKHSFFLCVQVWALLELTAYCLLVTLAPLVREGDLSAHKYALYVTAAAVSGVHLLCSLLLIVAAYKVGVLYENVHQIDEIF